MAKSWGVGVTVLSFTPDSHWTLLGSEAGSEGGKDTSMWGLYAPGDQVPHNLSCFGCNSSYLWGGGPDEHGVQSSPSRSLNPQVAPILPGDPLRLLW